MNLLLKETKDELKPFVLWSIWLVILLVGGLVKFEGLSGANATDMSLLLNSIPKPVLSMFGMAEVNIESFNGYYAILQFYALITLCAYSIHLGTNAIIKESADKTYEFLFTKPIGRIKILMIKIFNGLLYVTIMSGFNLIFSYVGPKLYLIENTVSNEIPLFVLSAYLISLLFFFTSTTISVFINRTELSVKIAHVFLMSSYGLSIVFDMDERFEAVRVFTPLKYFRPSELVEGIVNHKFLIGVPIVLLLLLFFTIIGFKRKDLNAG